MPSATPTETLPTTVKVLAAARVAETAAKLAGYVALTAVVYAETKSGLWVAAAMFAFYGLTVLVTPAAGWVADHWPRPQVLACSALASALCTAAMALDTAPWLLVVLAGVTALAEAPFSPASNALVPQLVKPAAVGRALGLLGVGRNVGYLAGPVAAGLCLAALGAAATFALAAVLLAGVALVLWAALPHGLDAAAESTESDSALAGVRWILRDPSLRLAFAAWTLVWLSFGMVIPGEVALADLFDAGSVGYGLLVASWGVGASAGSTLGSRPTNSQVLAAVRLGYLIAAVALATAGGVPWFGVAVAAMVVGGVGEGAATVVNQRLVARLAPSSAQGRVFAALEAASALGIALPLIAVGFLIDAAGVRVVYLLAGGVCALALGLLAHPQARQLTQRKNGHLSGQHIASASGKGTP